jgi:hypothetical protein
MKDPLEVIRAYPAHDYTLHGALESRLERDPRRPFVRFGAITWTWRQFADAADATARLLVVRGVGRGDRVAVMARNSDGHVLMLFALARIGAIMVIVRRFSASTFWQTVVKDEVTEVNIIEAIGTILKNRPRSEFRSDHKLRAVYGVRESVADTFRDEFRIPHRIGGYGMTEIPGVTCNPFEGPHKAGSMGPVGRHPDPARPWAQCRVVVDELPHTPTHKVAKALLRQDKSLRERATDLAQPVARSGTA